MTTTHMAAEPIALAALGDAPDDRLMQLISAGDISAFDTLYQRYVPRLRHYLYAQLGQAELAEEVCQDVLLTVWQQASRFRYASKPSTWMFGIAWRLVRQTRSREARRQPAMLVETSLDTGVDWEEPGQACERQEQGRLLSRGVAALPPALRRTLTLRYGHDYSYREIAAQMGCAEATVKDRLQQAKRRLGAMLRQRERGYAIAV